MQKKTLLFFLIITGVSFHLFAFPTNSVKKLKIIDSTYIQKDTSENETNGYWFVDQNATFRGGDVNNFNMWVRDHLRYPAEACEEGIYGKVVIQFSVNEQGKVCDIKIVKSAHPLLDNEVIRVISKSPKWKPAKKNQKPVKQKFLYPAVFSIQ
jgi:periplasmic protein TonB